MIIMPHQDQHIQPRKATWMFKKYGINLVLRTILFALGIYYFVTDKAQLTIQNIGLSEVITSGKIRSEQIHIHPKENIQSSIEEARRIVLGAKEDVSREVRHIARDLDVMRALPFDDSDLDVNSQARHILRMRRAKEIVPVAIFWVVFTALVGAVLFWLGWMSSEVVALWMLFFFWFDMVCVVLWCPLQFIFMKNRCCATCQIFNWDALMVATPLVFAWS